MNDTLLIDELNCTIVGDQNSKPDSAVVLCHGFGAPGTDLVPIASELIQIQPALANTLFVFPQAPIELDPFYDSLAWWMIDIEKIQTMMANGEVRELTNESPPELPERRTQIFKVIDYLREQFSLNSDQIVIGGFSQGAMLTTDVALHYPDQLAGLIVWSGALINESAWLKAAQTKSGLKVVQSHGRLDPILPFVAGEKLRDLLVKNGHDVEFIEFNGQHGIAPNAIAAALKLILTATKVSEQ